MDQKTQLEVLKKQARDYARQLREMAPMFEAMGDIEVRVSFADLAARIGGEPCRFSFTGIRG